MKVVDEVAAPDYKHAFVAQGRETLRKLVVNLGGLRLVYAELHDGNVSVGEDVAENRPSAVVESPTLVQADLGGREQIAYARRERGVSGRGILHLVKLAREAAEVVYGARGIGCGRERAGQIPVCGDA
jgi:hypothetical protein